jgi:hypothetical protein
VGHRLQHGNSTQEGEAGGIAEMAEKSASFEAITTASTSSKLIVLLPELIMAVSAVSRCLDSSDARPWEGLATRKNP